ncbi:UPF0262 family protein [Acidisoma cellulosilytica]|uniref:UPF0262 family protein n=1 Tax=Acidisoma cellulosilyticum TaxID=2802395 RepID=A0A964E393_9PROT|nr:UPF0262 family protein [Acidisoma cellulosilyticum]MCB8880455.1 UPF0262 family protein [Acidisoma cellulosilyticum]
MTNPSASPPHVSRIALEDKFPGHLPPLVEADRAQAIMDLEASNYFAPRGAGPGPFVLALSLRDGRLLFDIRDEAGNPVTLIGLALGPFRRLIKDYGLLLDSYATAVQDGREASIQAIDMGRRGLHNEGASLVAARLASKVAIDHDTARRLFTLVAVLHHRVTGPPTQSHTP